MWFEVKLGGHLNLSSIFYWLASDSGISDISVIFLIIIICPAHGKIEMNSENNV